jgi:hypothetical protein
MPSLTIHEVKEYSPFETNIFIETGTYMGDTVNEVKSSFEKVYSIELSDMYANRAIQRFKNDNNVNILKGDSSKLISLICKSIDKPCFFWLDGHWSSGNTAKGEKDVPLLDELNEIINHCKMECVIAIDDVRLFGTNITEDWSDITTENILQIVNKRLIDYKFYKSSIHPQDRLVLILKSQ